MCADVAEVESLSDTELLERAAEVKVDLGEDPLASRFGAIEPNLPYLQGLLQAAAVLKLRVAMSRRGAM